MQFTSYILLYSYVVGLNYPTTAGGVALLPDATFETQFPNAKKINIIPTGGKVYTTCVNANNWALTYDDGPQLPTLNLLAMLKQKNIKATFFVVGSNVRDYRDILKNTYDDGHEIAIHTWSHSDLKRLNNSQIMPELLYTQSIIEEVIGRTPLFMRPPFGSYDNRVIDVVLALDMYPVLWDHDTNDWQAPIQNTVDDWAKKGPVKGISLQHDIQQKYVDQAPLVMDKIGATGVKFVKMSECLGLNAYKVENAVTTTNEPISSTSATSITTQATATVQVVSTEVTSSPDVSTVETSKSTAATPLPSTKPGSYFNSEGYYLTIWICYAVLPLIVLPLF